MKYIITFCIIPLTYVVKGMVMCKLWSWFITPTFSIEVPSIPFVLGIALIVGFLTH